MGKQEVKLFINNSLMYWLKVALKYFQHTPLGKDYCTSKRYVYVTGIYRLEKIEGSFFILKTLLATRKRGQIFCSPIQGCNLLF